MKKKNLLLLVVLCTAMLMTVCSGQTPAESSVEKEPIETATGETYVTELVPGIIDEEQKTGETFNVNDYIN